MTFKYNRGLAYHVGLMIIAYIVLIQIRGWGQGTLVIIIFSGITTSMFNCYRIDITKDEMRIYQIYGGKTTILWEDVESVDIGKNMVEIPILGSVKNMTVTFYDKESLVVNIEPVIRTEMIDLLQNYCNLRTE